MKNSSKFKLSLFSILLGFSIFLYFNISNNLNKDIAIVDKEVVINEINNINKLIPLEIELSHSIIVSDNFTESDLFKKSQQITFFADCSYSIDLSSINDSNIVYNESNNITITIPNLEIFSIAINEDKTEFYQTEVGFFRFGELDISSEEFIIILNNVKQSFAEKMDDSDLYSLALDNTKNSIESLLLELTGEAFTVTLKTQ